MAGYVTAVLAFVRAELHGRGINNLAAGRLNFYSYELFVLRACALTISTYAIELIFMIKFAYSVI